MRLSLIAAMAFVLSAAASPAGAQTDARSWSPADNAFTLTFPETWVSTPPRTGDANVLLVLRPPAAVDATGCVVEHLGGSGPSVLNQEQHNDIMDLWATRNFPRHYQANEVISTSNDIVGGVRVFSFEVTSNDNDSREKVRLLSLASTNRQYRISCLLGAGSEHTAAADQFLSSLRIVSQ